MTEQITTSQRSYITDDLAFRAEFAPNAGDIKMHIQSHIRDARCTNPDCWISAYTERWAAAEGTATKMVTRKEILADATAEGVERYEAVQVEARAMLARIDELTKDEASELITTLKNPARGIITHWPAKRY